jgi:hypothetical protein
MRRESKEVYSDFSEVNCSWEYDGANIFKIRDSESESDVILSGEQALLLASFMISKISEHIE